MQIQEIIGALNQEIARLEQVRDLLANNASGEQTARRRGRPKGSLNKASAGKQAGNRGTKRQMSEEGRARIAAAQKKRWAAAKEAGERASDLPKKTSSAGGSRASKGSAKNAKTVKRASRPVKGRTAQKRAEPKPGQPDAAAAVE